ncbi:Dolichyl-phosphate-mannose--protein mannosyltransferase 1 [Zalerion maritima]|uniref:dolichyl-phosphate-mannose--protein mannosyltransferase n=1 Tax=Zalerion maritima TaxID=339359 RepID=A0AAD5RYF3_9PEZI|nr:Dolichyl-phosphate-mannose--protein mannosyltransferase 1 [Zalerion maritima]
MARKQSQQQQATKAADTASSGFSASAAPTPSSAAPMAARAPSPQPPAVKAAKPSKAKEAAKRKQDYGSIGVKDYDIFLLPVSDYQIMLVLTILAAAVRLFRIYQPTSVVFDEVHFGGFASKYIKGKFFMDVHPPLAKLLITLAGWLAGFDGKFDFKEIGKDYLEPGVPYVAMRMFPAICGVLLAPIMFLTLKAAGCRTMTATMGACLIIFENGLLTQARLILLDSPLMVATAFTAMAFTSFTNQHELGPSKAFSATWWFWLVMTGLGLGTTLSIKWVGLFTIAWVGSLTLIQLWVLLGDTKTVTMRIWAKHFMARAFCLIVIPLTFYMAMFAIHFAVLHNPGDGDGFMSSEFQSTLNNKGMKDVAVDVAMGSKVSIRHVNTQGGYLHSHPLMYPTGSKQQQITLYPHKDENNMWLLENQTQPIHHQTGEQINGTAAWNDLPAPAYVKNGDVIRLYHTSTHRRLHSHDVRAPVTEADWQNEVSAYGYDGFDGDANDLFRVEIIKHKSTSAIAKERVRTIQTKFKLVHIMSGCVLFSHKVKLPDWASEQQEVTCARGGTLPNSLWYVEYNEHPMLGEHAEKVNYAKPGFFGKFWELQKVMWKTNAGLVESHAWDSRPPSWPILRRGINFWGRNHLQVYLMGNPIVWWSSTAAVVAYVLFKGIAILRWQRSCSDYSSSTFKRFDYEIGTSVLGWALHYFPFYLMARQLFLHHYFPALYFAVIAFCQLFDFTTARIPGLGIRENPIINKATATSVLILAILVFYLFSPLAYGNQWTKSECKRLKLFDTWDFDCNTFPVNYADYGTMKPSSSKSATQTPQSSSAKAKQPPPPPPPPPAREQGQAQVPLQEAGNERQAAGISGSVPLPDNQKLLKREERVEYRDQDGNVLDPELVKELEGKVEFKTRYETRTRVVDAFGNEIQEPQGGWSKDLDQDQARDPVAPPHPDVEGADSETKRSSKQLIPDDPIPPPVESQEGAREAEVKEPKHASNRNEASMKNEEAAAAEAASGEESQGQAQAQATDHKVAEAAEAFV